jgi:amino acid adenylation domain-containing protein
MTDVREFAGSTMSVAQQALWLADRALPGGTQYNLGRVVHVDGPLDAAALAAALREVTARHEALRSRVVERGGQFMLAVEPAGGEEFAAADLSEAEADARAQALIARPFADDDPLWRAELHRLGPARHRLVLVVHHLVADASTIALLLSEIAALYRSRLAGEPSGLPSARPFSEYVAWENEFVASADCAAQVAYWTHQVCGVAPLELPADRPREPRSRHPGENLRFTLPAHEADLLRAVARKHRVTLTHALLACYATMLHRYAGRDELLVGVPLSIRHGGRWAASAGLFVNTMPIRTDLRGNPPFSQVLAQVRGTMSAALGAAQAPLSVVAAGAGALRSAGTGRLYDVIFGLTSRRMTIDLPGLACRVSSLYAGQAKFDLHLEITDDKAGTPLAGLLEYDTDLFDDSTARGFCDGFATIAAAAARAPGQPLGNMALWRGSAAKGGTEMESDALPGGGRVGTLFAANVAAHPRSVGMVDADSGTEYSYADLAARANAVAAALSDLGIGRGDFVGITVPRSAELVIAIVGVLQAGAAYVPLDASYPVKRLADMIETAQVRLVIGEAPAELGVPVIDVPPGAACGAAGTAATGAEGTAGTGDDPAYVMFTSGSTGTPKAVVVPHRAIVRLVRGNDFAAMTAAERWLHCASPSFDASTLELWAPLLNGGTVVVVPGRPTVADLGKAIRRHQVTSSFLTTGLFNLVVDTDVEELAPLRQLVIGGEAASENHVRRALAVVPTVVNGYGPTENTTFTTCYVMRDPALVPGPVPIGPAIAGTTVHVVDAYLNEMPPGAVGEIVTGGHGLALGYASAPALTAERFVPSPFGPPGSRLYRTGDYGKLGPDGVVHFAGRVDDQVKVRGFRIELGAIEHALLTHPGVRQAAVAVHADPSGDRRLVGYTVGSATPDQLTGHLRDQLPDYMIPGQWIALDAMPLGTTGKIDRGALPAPTAGSSGHSDAASPAQDLIVAWYTELLGLSDVSEDTDFFMVGGHSLFAARLVSRVKATFGVELSISAVFDNPRIADFAAVVNTSAERREHPGE